MKKKLLLLSSLAMCAAFIVLGTSAYFTAEEQVHNVLTTKGVNIKIEEWKETEDGLVPYPREEPVVAMPGITVSKIATIKNVEAECFIRAKVELVLKDKEGKIMELPPETIDSILSVRMNVDDWICKDGDSEWWYYDHAVATGVSTEPLFTEIIFDGPNLTNEYQNCAVEVIVKAQAVQTANNGNSSMDSTGWPAE